MISEEGKRGMDSNPRLPVHEASVRYAAMSAEKSYSPPSISGSRRIVIVPV